MKLRHFLIILSSLFLLALFVITYIIGFALGANYGESHAEEIRDKKVQAIEEVQGKEASKVAYVKAQPFSNTQVPIAVSGFGQVVSSSTINITAEVQGIIRTKVPLKKGTKFKKGQVLFSIRNGDIKLALQARKSAYLTLVTGVLPDLKLDFPDNFEAWNTFYTTIDISKRLPPLPQVMNSQEKNFAVSRNIFSEYYNIKSEEARLSKYTIYAPFDGSILNAYTDDGAVVGPGTPVVEALRDGQLEIEIPISAADIDLVQMDAVVSLLDDAGVSAQGKVIRKGDYINPQTQTMSVFVAIESSSGVLYNGMYLTATITCEGYENAMEIPRKALVDNQTIYTVADNILQKQTVKIKSFQKSTVIVSNIENGTVIVTEPLINPKEGMEVELLKSSNI